MDGIQASAAAQHHCMQWGHFLKGFQQQMSLKRARIIFSRCICHYLLVSADD